MFILILVFSISVFSQCPKDTTGYRVFMDFTICFTDVSYSVEYNENCNCYYYNYTISSRNENKANICHIYTLFKTNKSYKTIDETLPYNPQCDFPYGYMQKFKDWQYKLIPYSVLECPEKWDSGPHTGLGCAKEDYLLKPGQTISFKIASKFPPGEQELGLEPDDADFDERWDEFVQDCIDACGPGDFNPPYTSPDFYEYNVKVIGPVDPEDLDLFNGGGQKPDDVNLFLRYGNPKESQTELPSGTTNFEVLIYYGKTIKKETFQATLNSKDIKNLFHPVPGGGDWVKINLQSGRNVLEFSIDGVRQDGRVANDKDRLVLIVK